MSIQIKKTAIIAGLLCFALLGSTGCAVMPVTGNNFQLAAMADPAGIYGNTFGNGGVIEVSFELPDDELEDLLGGDGEYRRAVLTVNGSTLYDIGLTLEDGEVCRYLVRTGEFELGQTFKGLDFLTLDGSCGDPSYMRELLTYSASLSLGGMTPCISYATLTVNGELQGLCLMTEGVGEGFIRRNSALSDDTVLYYASKAGCTLAPGSDAGGFEVEYGRDDGRDNIKRLISALNSAGEPGAEELSQILNVESVLKAAAVDFVTGNSGGYGGESADGYYLLYSEGRFSYVRGAGGDSFGAGQGVEADITSPASGAGLSGRPLFAKLLDVPEYYAKYEGYVRALTDYFANFESMVSNIAAVIRIHVAGGSSARHTKSEFNASVSAGAVASNGGAQSGEGTSVAPDSTHADESSAKAESTGSIVAYMAERLSKIKEQLPAAK